MEYEDDFNCAVIAVKKNGRMTLREIGERLSISFVRVKQIQDRALQKLRNKMQNIN
jgi:DNA-directed RNA polymerase specialized sigma subunit